MRRFKLVIVLLIIFSFVVKSFVDIQLAHAGTTKIELIDESNLKLEYDYNTKDNLTQWKIAFKRRSEENSQQRLKFKVLDEKKIKINYPNVENMEENEEWLVEKNYTEMADGQIVLDLPKSVETLYLYLQMDEKGLAEDSEIKENILEREKPFKLEIKKEQKKEIKESTSEKEESSVASTESKEKNSVIGPQLSMKSTLRSGSITAYQNQYVNKVPVYTDSPTDGKYPANAWSPTGQAETIRNHQGGNSADSANVWDGVTEWNVSQDNRTKSYINYGADRTNPNLSLRKLAYATDKEDEFNIRLNVRGNTTYKPGVDVVFLVDNTGTMGHAVINGKNRRDRANGALAKIIQEFKKAKVDENIRIGAYFFSDGQFEKDFGKPLSYPLSSTTSKWDELVTNHKTMFPTGPTFTQRGLDKAEELFDNGGSDTRGRKKLLFVLTDGAPNSSYMPNSSNPGATRIGSIYLDGVHIENWQKVNSGSYNAGTGSVLGASGTGTKFNPNNTKYYNALPVTSHLTTTNSTAYDLKQAGIEIHTVAVAIEKNTSPPYTDHTKRELEEGLARMSTQKNNTTGTSISDFFFNSYTDTDDLTEGIKEWYETVISTVNKGIITDPIGDMFTLVGNPTLKTFDEHGDQNTLIPPPDNPIINGNNEIVVKNITLKKGEEAQIDYRVKLKPTAKKGVWYQTNGPTTLQPTPERSSDVIDFGVPSVRLKADEIISIPVVKEWENDQNNYWARRKPVTIELQKKTGSTWTKVGETISLSEGTNWKGTFANIVNLPDTTYRVVEKSPPAGYSVRYSPTEFTKSTLSSTTIKVINTMKKTDFEFEKFMNDGKTHFDIKGELPEFQIKDHQTQKEITGITPKSSGKVTLENLPIGEYTVSESVLTGYKEIPDFILKIEEDASGNLITKVNGQIYNNTTKPYKVTNELKDFSLEVNKKNNLNKPLSGASFRLRGIAGNTYNKLITTGSTFTFGELRPGRYLLSEEDAPNGFTGLTEDIEIIITDSGLVGVDPKGQVDLVEEGWGMITDTGNIIKITVRNNPARAGQAPRTGGQGNKKMMMVSIELVGTSALAGICYFFLNRKNW